MGKKTEQLKALIVEDNPDLSFIFSEAMSFAGFETEVMNNGTAADEHLQEATPDLIILDLHLPHMNGTELLKRIRANRRLQNTKVVVVSADGVAAMALSESADLVLTKPVSLNQLITLSNRIMKPYKSAADEADKVA